MCALLIFEQTGEEARVGVVRVLVSCLSQICSREGVRRQDGHEKGRTSRGSCVRVVRADMAISWEQWKEQDPPRFPPFHCGSLAINKEPPPSPTAFNPTPAPPRRAIQFLNRYN